MTQWSTQDIVFTATGPANPYVDASAVITATFTGPAGSGISQSVKSFWNGSNNYVVRFTPTVQGTWTYTTSTGSSLSNVVNTTDGTGQIVVSAALSGEHGFVRINPSYTNSFTYDDGTPYFMWGQTYYDLMQDAMVNDNWQTAVDNSAAYGMNKIRLRAYAQGGFIGLDNVDHGYPDVVPYAGTADSPNRDGLNFAYLQKLDQVVQYLDSKGVVADLMLLSTYANSTMPGTLAQDERFASYITTRYSAYDNVIWCLTNEWADGGMTQSYFNDMGAIVRSGDPWLSSTAGLRPLSIHQNTGIDFEYFGTSWPTHAIIQYGPRNSDSYTTGDDWGNAGIVQNLGHDMPVVNDEYGYINDSGVGMDRAKSRQTIWGIAAAGGYGSMGDIRLFGSGATQWTPCKTGEWADAPGEYGDISKLVAFFTTKGVEFWKMTSHNELKIQSTGKRDYLLAEPGRQYVLYTATGDSAARINLSGYSGNFNVVKYDPTNGAMTTLGSVAGGATRSWNLTGTNSAGGTDWVLLVTALDVPGVLPAVPTSLATTVISSSRIDLAWTDRSSSETGFEIDRATNSTFTSGLTTVTVGANVTTYQSTGLTSGTKYYYRVRATLGGTADSANSNTASAIAGNIPPAAPTGLSATAASATQINLSWTDTSGDETGFEIDRATNSGFTSGLTTATVTFNVTTYQSSGLTEGTTYYYRVRSTIGGSNDSANSNTANATSNPATPTGLGATVISGSRIDLAWTDASTHETGFEIDRATNSSFTSGLTTATVGANVTTYQSTGLTLGTTYYYRVRATIGGANDSANSGTASGTPIGAPVQLLSDYTFDDSVGGQIASGAPTGGTVAGSAVSGSSGAALIGAGGLSLASYQSYFNEASGSRPNATDGGALIGTESIWIKIIQSGGNNYPMFFVASDGTSTINHGAFGNFSANTLNWYSKNNGGSNMAAYSASTAAWDDGGSAWHLMTVTYSLAINGGSTATIYLDGTVLTTTEGQDNLTTTAGIGDFSTWGVSRDYVNPAGSQGSMDDFGVWGTRLNSAQVSALYNLGIAGVAGTKYNAKDASALFDAFSAGAGVATSDGRTWTYVASGLAGAAGSVGANYVVLDDSGGGMVFGVPVDVTWTGVGGSTWSTAVGSGNWMKTSDSTSADYFDGVDVVFNDTATGTIVNISAEDVTPTSVTFNNSSDEFVVTGVKGIAGTSTTVLKQGSGTVIISSANTYGGVTTVEAGTLKLNGVTNAQVPVLTGAGADIKGGMLVLDYSGEASPAATVNTLINNGKIHSSVATATYGLGWIDNTTTHAISIAYTVYGDANLDGSVNFSDLSKLLSKYNQPGVWADGDFNYDGVVNFADLSKLLSTYNQSIGLLIPAGSPLNVVDLSAPQVAGDDGSATIVPAAPVTTAEPVEDALPSRRPVAIRHAAAIRPAAVDRIDLFALAAYELTRRTSVEHLFSATDETDQPFGPQITAHHVTGQHNMRSARGFADYSGGHRY